MARRLTKKIILKEANGGGCDFDGKVELVCRLKYKLNRNIKAYLDGLLASGEYYFEGTILKKKKDEKTIEI